MQSVTSRNIILFLVSFINLAHTVYGNDDAQVRKSITVNDAEGKSQLLSHQYSDFEQPDEQETQTNDPGINVIEKSFKMDNVNLPVSALIGHAKAFSSRVYQHAAATKHDCSAYLNEDKKVQNAALSIQGLNKNKPVIWLGAKYKICYSLLPSNSHFKRRLILWVGDSSTGYYYPNVLGSGNQIFEDNFRCRPFEISTGVPVGLQTITIGDLQWHTYACISFNTALAMVYFSRFQYFFMPESKKSYLRLTIYWSVDAGHASPKDKVQVWDSKGRVAYWFYTSCKCQTKAGTKAVASGFNSFNIERSKAVPGGYVVKFYPEGGSLVAAEGPNWIHWDQLPGF